MTRAFFVLLKREIGALMISPMAYVIFTLFSFVTALIFQLCVTRMENIQYVTIMQLFFQNFFFWLILLLLTPIVTMRLLSEEYRSGTVELLLTAPVTDWDVVLAKFLAALGFYCVLWTPTVVYAAAYRMVAGSQFALDLGQLSISYAILLLVGSFFISIGLFTSSLTRSQSIAAFASFAIIVVFFILGILVYFTTESVYGDFLRYISVIQHVQEFTEGTFDSRPVVLYLSGTALFLVLAQRVALNRKFKH